MPVSTDLSLNAPAKIWNLIDNPMQIWNKVPAKFEVWYIVPESGGHTLA